MLFKAASRQLHINSWEEMSYFSLHTLTYVQIVTVGAQPHLSRWSFGGNLLSQVKIAPPSALSVSVHSSGVSQDFLRKNDEYWPRMFVDVHHITSSALKLTNLFCWTDNCYSRLWRFGGHYNGVWKSSVHVSLLFNELIMSQVECSAVSTKERIIGTKVIERQTQICHSRDQDASRIYCCRHSCHPYI